MKFVFMLYAIKAIQISCNILKRGSGCRMSQSHRRHLFKQPEKMCEHLCWPSKRVEKKTIIKYHSQKRSFHFISFQFNSLFVFVSLSRHAMSGLESCERKQKDIWKQINDFRTYLVATTTMNNNIVLIYFMLKVKVRCFKLSSQKMM